MFSRDFCGSAWVNMGLRGFSYPLVMTFTVRHGKWPIGIDGLPVYLLIAWWFSMANCECHNQRVNPWNLANPAQMRGLTRAWAAWSSESPVMDQGEMDRWIMDGSGDPKTCIDAIYIYTYLIVMIYEQYSCITVYRYIYITLYTI